MSILKRTFLNAICIYNRAVPSAIMDKSGRVISGRKIGRVRRTRSIFHPEITSPDLSIIARAIPLDYLLIAFINYPEALSWWVYVTSECNYNNGVQFRNNYCVRNGDYNAI